MSIDSLFTAVDPNSALIGRLRGLLNNLRRTSPVLAPGCGCLLPISAVSVRDFEQALLFHLQERVRASGKDIDQRAAPAASLDQLLDWLETVNAEPQLRSFCRALLEETERSLISFTSQCSVHAARPQV